MWGEMESESEEEESEEEEEEEEEAEEAVDPSGMQTPIIDAGLATPSGMSSVGAPGQETPELVSQVRKTQFQNINLLKSPQITFIFKISNSNTLHTYTKNINLTRFYF